MNKSRSSATASQLLDEEHQHLLLDESLPSSAEPLGRPLPLDEHACSVSLPTWCSIVGYEEGDPKVTSQLSCGYPRFAYHPYIIQLMDYAVETHGSKKERCLILPSPEAAARFQVFLQQALYGTKNLTDNALVMEDTENNNNFIRVVKLHTNIHAVLFPAETLAGVEAKAYWQHTGEIVSSRRAEVALRELDIPLKEVTPQFLNTKKGRPAAAIVHHSAQESCDSIYDKLRARIANLTRVPPSHVHLAASGMASLYKALRSSRRLKMHSSEKKSSGGGTSIVFGFPYLDTLKLCSRKEFCPEGVEFFGRGDKDDLEKLELLLQQQNQAKQPNEYCALFTEVPSNPLLQTPNVHKLRELTTKHDIALIVDDTIGNFANVDILGNHAGSADAVCTSLTKLFSGRGDAMAGSLVVNPNTVTGQQLQADLVSTQTELSGGLFNADAWAIYHNSQDFLERNDRINDTSERLCDWLKEHKDIERVYYPKYTDLYHQVHAPGGGYGGLFSILLENHVCQRTFFDALDISKGPSLGTNFTLMCPYTLLAHYHELDFAMAYDVKPNLLRIAVGLESFETLQGRFEVALEKSRLYPPLPKTAVAAGHQTCMYSTPMPTPTITTTATTRALARFGLQTGKRFVR